MDNSSDYIRMKMEEDKRKQEFREFDNSVHSGKRDALENSILSLSS